MTAPIKGYSADPGQWSVEQMKRSGGVGVEAEKARLRKATKEFESFFIYQMLKTMRETVPENPLTKDAAMSDGLGKETFTQMFDMEIARKVTISGGNSIADLLYNSMEKLVEAQYGQESEAQPLKALKLPEHRPIELPKVRAKPLLQEKEAIPLKKKAVDALPIRTSQRTVVEDPILARYGEYIHAAARETKLDSALIASVIKAESSGNPKAVSPAGAKGLMQLADSTVQDLKVTDAFDPEENIKAGSRYLKSMLDRFGSVDLALAAYNAGPGTVEKYGGIPPFSETRNYVKRVTALVGEVALSAVAPSVGAALSVGDNPLSDDKLSADKLKVSSRQVDNTTIGNHE
jgi:Rod binding domain-containing protein